MSLSEKKVQAQYDRLKNLSNMELDMEANDIELMPAMRSEKEHAIVEALRRVRNERMF